MLRKDTTVPHPTIFFKTDIFCTTLMALGHEQLLDAFQLFWKPRVALSKSSGETRILFHRNIGGNSQCNSGGTPNEKVSLLAILGDLFGMVSDPFKWLSDLQCHGLNHLALVASLHH